MLIRRGLHGRVTKTTISLTWLAAFALIAVGVLCLSLSGAVARTGSWWQGTWQALGVGFVVGGIVDVLAISAMNQYAGAISQRRLNEEAKAIVDGARRVPVESPDFAFWSGLAELYLERQGDVLYREVFDALAEIIRLQIHRDDIPSS